MTPEQLQELEEKAKLWDKYSPELLKLHGFERPKVIPNLDGEITENGKGAKQFRYGKMDCELTEEGFLRVPDGTRTIHNTSNSSSYIGLLNEEFGEHLCSCNLKKCECLTTQDTLEKM